MLLASGCGASSDTTSTGGSASTTSSATPPRSTPGAAKKGQPGGGPATTPGGSVVPAGAGDLKDFCATAKKLKLTSLDGFAQTEKKGAVALVFGLGHLQKVAPPDIVGAVGDERPLAEALNEQIKVGMVHDVASYKAWLDKLNAVKADSLKKWIAANQLLVPYIQKNCP